MSIGDVTNPKRVRLQANERLDTVDADPLSLTAREHLDAYSRAVEATPRNVGSSTPTGLIIQGFGLTLNPINPTDGKVRVQSALGVAFDANGRLLIKEAGITQDLTLSAGNSQIYVYYLDTASDTAIRRSISVGSPYTESPSAISTKFTAGVGFFVRAGDQTSIVASDVVNGATTALCFLGVANNAGGAVTMTGYNSTTAPNGSFTTNRLTTVMVPTTLPALNTYNGSIATIHGLVNAALYMIGQTIWKSSTTFTPSAANNFGAFTVPTVGLDDVYVSLNNLFTNAAAALWSSVTFAAGTAVTVNSLLTANGGVTASHYNLPSTTFTIPAAAFKAVIGSPTLDGGAGSGLWTFASGANNTIECSLQLPVGTRITALKFHVNRASSTSGAIVSSLNSKVLGGGVFNQGTPSGLYTDSLSTTGTYQTRDLVSIAGSPFTTISGSAYYLEIDTNLVYVGAPPQFDGVEVTIDHT